jgi:hypothetical protein
MTLQYKYVTDVAGGNGHYAYVVQATGGTVDLATGKQVYPV